VGWIYEYALVDKTGRHDLAQLRSIQDWFLRYELKSVPGVAEVASIGGMVKQYQVVLDPQSAGLLWRDAATDVAMPSSAPIRKLAAPSSRWPKPNMSCAPPAI
jgi:hypothetical protein